jgi:hypothetical protein
MLLPSRPSSFVYNPVSLSELLKLLLLIISLKTERNTIKAKALFVLSRPHESRDSVLSRATGYELDD